ncbi:hypothetical protein BACFIN_07954 [Bacteroides finegoldii DSM 17565]|nr:hypothetical protein BACFIN_07954 [Bacteroides finegoldii DSM 17565]
MFTKIKIKLNNRLKSLHSFYISIPFVLPFNEITVTLRPV